MTALARLVGVVRTYTGTSAGSRPQQLQHVLRSVDLTLHAGDHVAVQGRSGAGKSTLLNVLGLLDAPTSGEYELDGRPTSTMRDAERAYVRATRLGFVFQAFHLVPYRSVLDNVAMGLAYRPGSRADRRRAAFDALERVGMADRAAESPAILSGGERQRVAIARATVGRPALLLCDEPTGNLDAENAAVMLAMFDDLLRDGLTVVVITHDDEVARSARRRLRLVDGRLVEHDPVA